MFKSNIKLNLNKNVGTNDCCTYINISSTGVASEDYSMMMGRYKKFSTDRLGVSSYKRGIYILYKYYAGSTHTTWLVSCGLSIKKLCLPCNCCLASRKFTGTTTFIFHLD